MPKEPVFVTGLTLARSQDFVVAALYAPNGEFRSGRLEAGEVVRLVMSLSTLRAMTETMIATCREIEAANAAAAPVAGGSPATDGAVTAPGLAGTLLKH